MIHEGRLLKSAVSMRGFSVAAFARTLGVSRDAVNKWFSLETLNVRRDNLVRIAAALNVPDEQLQEMVRAAAAAKSAEERRSREPDVFLSLEASNWEGKVRAALIRHLMGQSPPPKSSGESERRLPSGKTMPPVFRLGIAASGWVELEAAGITPSDLQYAEGWFAIEVRGDSMIPRFRNGQLVMFKRLNKAEDEPQRGRDYLFVRHDEHGTLKRIVDVDDDGFKLKALNPKYPKTLSISRDEAVLVAEPRFEIKELEEP